MLFSLLKHYLELCITDTALKVSRFLYCVLRAAKRDLVYDPSVIGVTSGKILTFTKNISFSLNTWKLYSWLHYDITVEDTHPFVHLSLHCDRPSVSSIWGHKINLNPQPQL